MNKIDKYKVKIRLIILQVITNYFGTATNR